MNVWTNEGQTLSLLKMMYKSLYNKNKLFKWKATLFKWEIIAKKNIAKKWKYKFQIQIRTNESLPSECLSERDTICSNEEPHSSLRGDYCKIARILWQNLKIFISKPPWLIAININKLYLGIGNFMGFFKILKI